MKARCRGLIHASSVAAGQFVRCILFINIFSTKQTAHHRTAHFISSHLLFSLLLLLLLVNTIFGYFLLRCNIEFEHINNFCTQKATPRFRIVVTTMTSYLVSYNQNNMAIYSQHSTNFGINFQHTDKLEFYSSNTNSIIINDGSRISAY